MEWLNLADTHFLLSLCVSLFIFSAFYLIASKKQDRALEKVEALLKLQEQANQSLMIIIAESRRTNHILADLAGLEISEQAHYSPQANQHQHMATNYNSGAMSHDGSAGVDSANKLYVGNVDYAASESELAGYFASYGQVEYVNIPINRYTGRARGFGFVTFSSKADAERAMALNGSEFRGRQIQVNFAKERETA
jgi:hypothetical protein